MKVTIHSTSKVVAINGVPARIWEGETDTGIAVQCYVTRVSVERSENTAQFAVELTQHEPPSPEVEAIPLRLIL